MNYMSVPDLSQALLEAQMRVIELVMLVTAISVIVSLAIYLGTIAWLCFCETKPRRTRPLPGT